ncbi:MAG: hypothetical protein SRB1_02079 [Desulfobacteraceae bacterium Eth-SRB1]|nr:MAG: hypothetical protein SRB1_02079 [Desulfobacteraceae bacterium Eth-SRB1]
MILSAPGGLFFITFVRKVMKIKYPVKSRKSCPIKLIDGNQHLWDLVKTS